MAKKIIEILEEGSGKIFSKITPNEFREHMREKVKNAWQDKMMDIKTAIGEFVHDGDYLTMGGGSASSGSPCRLFMKSYDKRRET